MRHKRRTETENHMCITPNRLVYFRLSKAKRSQKFSALKLHFLSLGRDRLTAPAPNWPLLLLLPLVPLIHAPSFCPELWKWVCLRLYGVRISGLPGCLGRFAWAHGTCKVTCMSAPVCGSVHRRVCFHRPAKQHQIQLQHQHQNRH